MSKLPTGSEKKELEKAVQQAADKLRLLEQNKLQARSQLLRIQLILSKRPTE